MNCVILSPKKESRKAIEKAISQNVNFNVLKSVANLDDAKDVLLNHKKVDVVFIEIVHPGMDGWGMLEKLPNGRPHKIFLSTQKELAKDAFDYDGADFILLPLTQINLMKAIAKITKQNKNILSSTVNHDFIFIKTNKTIQKIEIKDILYIEALADYVTIQTTEKRYTVHSTMKGILNKLPEHNFVRVHKSYIAHVDLISKIESNSITIGNASIPLSRAYKKELMDRIEFLL